MDALRNAELVLARLHSSHPEYAVPGWVGSPMDDRITVTLSRDLIRACEPATVDEGMLRAAQGTSRPVEHRRAG